ncbi:MAG TPA: hypothetical protein VEI97_17065 [bacterium]|nr:hypothetical protein [bacterium]
MAERTIPSPVEASPEVARKVNGSAFLILLAIVAGVALFVIVVSRYMAPPDPAAQATAQGMSIQPIAGEADPAPEAE